MIMVIIGIATILIKIGSKIENQEQRLKVLEEHKEKHQLKMESQLEAIRSELSKLREELAENRGRQQTGRHPTTQT